MVLWEIARWCLGIVLEFPTLFQSYLWENVSINSVGIVDLVG